MGMVGIHLSYEWRASSERPCQARHVGPTESGLFRPVQDRQPARKPGGQFIGEFARSIRGAIVNHEQPVSVAEGQDLLRQRREVVTLVVGGNDDRDGRDGGGFTQASASPLPRASRNCTWTSSASTSNGLESKASASSSSVRSRRVLLADIATIGMSDVPASSRSRAMRAPPSTPGSI